MLLLLLAYMFYVMTFGFLFFPFFTFRYDGVSLIVGDRLANNGLVAARD